MVAGAIGAVQTAALIRAIRTRSVRRGHVGRARRVRWDSTTGLEEGRKPRARSRAASTSQLAPIQMEDKEAIRQIRDELARFSIVTEPAKTLFGRVRRTYTGKIGGMQDDLAIAIQLAITSMRRYLLSDKYSNFRFH